MAPAAAGRAARRPAVEAFEEHGPVVQNGALAGFDLGGDVRYIGETFGDKANTAGMTIPDYTLFNGVVDYETGDWRLAVNRLEHCRRDHAHLLGHLLLRRRPRGSRFHPPPLVKRIPLNYVE